MFLKKIPGMYKTEEWSAMFLVASFLLFNIFTIFSFIQIFTGKPFPPQMPRLQFTILLAIYITIHYFIFIYRGRYKIILDRYQDESKEDKKRKNKYVLSYCIGSIVVLFGANLIKTLIWGTP